MKVLIIDRDVLARQAIAKVLQYKTDYDVHVSGEYDAVTDYIQKTNPDALLFAMDNDPLSLMHFESIRNQFPDLPVVLLTKRTEEGAKIALYALMKGAIDFVTKPEHKSIVLFAGRHLEKRLIPIVEVALQQRDRQKIDRLSRRILRTEQQEIQTTNDVQGSSEIPMPVRFITIGACTGGPLALFDILPNLPSDFPVPIVIVQHVPKYYTKVLADKLNKSSKINVEEAYNGLELNSGTAWIIPGGYHAEVQQDGIKTNLKLHKGPKENGYRPSIDQLFRSAGKTFGPGTLGVILSGCGTDGLDGVELIKDEGGRILVQDPRTATGFSLPLTIIKSGYADGIYPSQKISEQLIERTKRVALSDKGKKYADLPNKFASNMWHELMY